VEALTRLPDTVEHALLHIDLVCHDLSDPLNILARYERLLEHLRDAAGLAEKIGDRARLADAVARMLHPLRNPASSSAPWRSASGHVASPMMSVTRR
jgi:hypothetical protein